MDDLDPADFRRSNPRFRPENLPHNLAMRDALRPIADEKGISLAQLALAWILAQAGGIVPIPGIARRTHLEENARAAEVELTTIDLAAIEAAFPVEAVAGERLADWSRIDR